MRSVVVVLPASMCAMMPMFLQRSNGTCLAKAFFRFLLRPQLLKTYWYCRLRARFARPSS
jgi:hypothetical protein